LDHLRVEAADHEVNDASVWGEPPVSIEFRNPAASTEYIHLDE
jgi:hypothetical protein